MKPSRLFFLFHPWVAIMILGGCSGKKAKTDKALKIDTAAMNQSFADFKNRPVHKKLTVDIIDNTKDKDLIQVVFDNLVAKIPEAPNKEYAMVMSFNKPRQAIYVIWMLDAEVNNGGFNQFYYNSSGQFAHLAPWALKLIGANKFADLTSKANAIYNAQKSKLKEKQDGTMEGFSKSYDDNPLNDLDTQYYKLTEPIEQLQIDFIRKNKKDFIDN